MRFDGAAGRIKFNSIYPDFVKLAANPFKLRSVIVRASMQVWDQNGVDGEVPVKAEMRGFFREWDSGNVKKGENAEAEATLSVIYFRLEVDGNEIVEVDTINNIYKVEGEDVLQNYKQNIGG